MPQFYKKQLATQVNTNPALKRGSELINVVGMQLKKSRAGGNAI